MTYTVLSVDLSRMTATERGALAAAAAEVDIDIDDLSSEMPVGPRAAIVASAMLSAVLVKLSEHRPRAVSTALWELLRPPLTSGEADYAVEDSQTRISFVWSRQAKLRGPDAARSMTKVCGALDTIPNGAVFYWNDAASQWHLADPGVGKPTVVVLTALQLEYEACRRHLVNPVIHNHPAGTKFDVADLPGGPWRVCLGMVGRGGTAAAVLAERAISQFRPAALIFVGIAGALRSDLRLGDVVVASFVHAFQSGREEPEGLLAQPRTWQASPELLEFARYVALDDAWKREFLPDSSPRVFFAPIAAGDVVLNAKDSHAARLIRSFANDAAAIEMESAGIAQASHLNNSLPALPIRGISDYADGRKDQHDSTGSQPRAAARAAAFAFALIGAFTGGMWSSDQRERP